MNEDLRGRTIIRQAADGLPVAEILGGVVVSNDDALDAIRKVRARLIDDSVKGLPDNRR